MRTFVLLIVLAIPLLVLGGIARAGAANDIGKPVCSHYDESASKSSDTHAMQQNANVAAAPGTSAGPSASTVLAPPPTAKSGGSPTELRQHNSPRWQAFLPGMFR